MTYKRRDGRQSTLQQKNSLWTFLLQYSRVSSSLLQDPEVTPLHVSGWVGWEETDKCSCAKRLAAYFLLPEVSPVIAARLQSSERKTCVHVELYASSNTKAS